ALQQAVDLLPERLADPRLVEMEKVARRRTERPDGPRDRRVPTHDVARLAGDPGRGAVEPVRLRREPESREPDPVGPERRRLDEIGARLEVGPVDRPDELRPGRRELVQARPLRDATGE